MGDSVANSYIEFDYPGYWMAVDYKLELLLNDEIIRNFQFKEGVHFEIPVSKGKNKLTIKYGALGKFRAKTLVLEVSEGKTYHVQLTYSRFWGNFSLKLVD